MSYDLSDVCEAINSLTGQVERLADEAVKMRKALTAPAEVKLEARDAIWQEVDKFERGIKGIGGKVE